MKRRSMVNTGDISPEKAIGDYRLRRKGRVKEMSFQRDESKQNCQHGADSDRWR